MRFSHIINPFPAKPGSEHAIASAITYATLRRAYAEARSKGVGVEVRAVVLPGDEPAIEPPAEMAPHLTRTVQDICPLRPPRPLPLIADILTKGATGARGSHLIFSNMDISVQPDFYVTLNTLMRDRFDESRPFAVYRRNISAQYSRLDQLDQMYAEQGTRAYGYDCFVFPARYLEKLDLGQCCIGSAYFDLLLFMALDAASGFRAARVGGIRLTFHIGNEIEWTRHMDYIEHNLAESLGAIKRMRERVEVPADSIFASMEKEQFISHTHLPSVLARKVKRIPGVAATAHRVKKALGRSH